MRAAEAADGDDAMNDTSSALAQPATSASGAEGKGAAGAAAPSLDAGVSEADEYKKESNAFKANGNAINTGILRKVRQMSFNFAPPVNCLLNPAALPLHRLGESPFRG
ncbi:hypothetical protein TcCL_Unassigned05514 [Trypanosoma cruzi]|nr:hypothetical protein TcCL_Unassigned05514 [Trypanosoma cruzi]